MKWYLYAYRNFIHFKGRAGITEYWLFALFNACFATIAIALDIALKTSFTRYGQSLFAGWIYSIYSLLALLPGLSVTVRRLHDTGRNGWYFLIPLVSTAAFYLCLAAAIKKATWHENEAAAEWITGGLITLCLGMILFAIVLRLKGDEGANQYGERTPATAAAHENAASSLVVLLILVESCSRILSYLWSAASTRLSGLANSDFTHYRQRQESFMVVMYLLGFVSLFVLMGLSFTIKDKWQRIALLLITAAVALLQLHYSYSLVSHALYGK